MWSGRKLALGVLGLITVPVILTCIDPAWLFPPPGIDSWIYLGFFRNFSEYQAVAFPDTYYGSRLSWILPGYCIHQLLPAVAANCVLHLGMHLLAVLSLFESLRHTTSPRAAFLAALCMAGHRQFLGSVGWDYVDGVGTAYYLLTWALIVRAARSSRLRPWLFGAGASAAAAFYSNACWLPVLALYLPGYALLRRRWEGKASTADAHTQVIMMLAGAAALTMVLGAANWLAGGSFLFYRPSLKFALSSIGTPNHWAISIADWFPSASWLVWPTCAIAGNLVYLACSWFQSTVTRDTISEWWCVNLLLNSLLFVAESLAGMPVLQFSYYTSYLLGPLMLALGSLLAAPVARLTTPAFCFAAGLIVAGAAFGAADVASLLDREDWLPGGIGLFHPIAFTLAGFLWLGFQPRVRWAALLAIALLAVGNAQLPQSFEMVTTGLGWETSGDIRRLNRERREMYSRITESAHHIDGIASARRTESRRPKVWFWYDVNEAIGWQHRSLGSLWLFMYSLVNERFPTWGPASGSQMRPGDMVVVPSQRTDSVAEALRAWQHVELGLRLLNIRTIGAGACQSTLAVFILEPRHL